MKLDCRELAQRKLDLAKSKVENSNIKGKDVAIIQVGNRPDSTSYVRNKNKRVEYVGLTPRHIQLDENTGYWDLLHLIDDLNFDKGVVGIILQLPLPDKLKEYTEDFINRIAEDKDIDALCSERKLSLYNGNTQILPCTVQAVIDVLDELILVPEGKVVLIAGRSDIVGKPLIHALLQKNYTPICAHSKSDIADLYGRMGNKIDVVVMATGVQDIIKSFHKNTIVIDVGISLDNNGKLRGDISEEIKQSSGCVYTPVPNGIGQLTTANVILNTLKLNGVM